LPCLYPHVEAPESNDTDSYALYMSRGVLLEAGIVAGDIVEAGSGVKRVVQVLRADDEAARAAAGSLRRALRAAGIEEEERRIDALAALDAATKATAASDALILWLRPDDLKRLNPRRSPAARLYLSGTLADFERAALPAAWKADALMAYPYELPQKRISRTAQFKAWLRARGLALVDEPVQSDAYLACSALRMGMNELAGHPQRDYLVERLQVLTEQGGFVGNYPSLSLGIGQQFASKSGYLVRFEKPDFRRIAAVGERVAP